MRINPDNNHNHRKYHQRNIFKTKYTRWTSTNHYNIKRNKLVIITLYLFFCNTNIIYNAELVYYYNIRDMTIDQTQSDDYIQGLVSVIIPTYNRYELLNHSIRSVLSNTYKHVEIIVINDCSTDQRYYSGELEKYEKTTILHLPVNMRMKQI